MAKRKSWKDRIDAAEKRGKFTPDEVRLARDNWLTCAVGEKHGWPQGFDEITTDESWFYSTEYRLGTDFGLAVNAQNIPEARRLYEEIMAL